MYSRTSNSIQSRARRGRGRRGAFTLVELISTIVISSIVCGSAATLLWNAAQQRSEIAARGDLVDIGSVALERMVRHLRDITQNECIGNPTPCLNGNAQVSTAGAAQIRWGNYGFRQSGTELQMTTDNAANWYTLASDLSSLQLIYYDRLGATTTTAASIRRITITLTLARANQTVALRTGLYLRNFMNEVTTDP